MKVALEEIERRGYAESPDPQPGSACRKIRSIWLAQTSLARRPEWLVKGIIPAGGFVEIYGQAGCGKSFLVLNFGMHIARALPCFERKVVTPGLVAYVAAEGGVGVEKRIVAYRQYHGIEDEDPPFLLIPERLDLRNVGMGDVAALIELLKEAVRQRNVPLVALIIDTLNRTFGGGNENGPEDMGQFVANCDHIGRETGAARLVVHHEGRQANGRGGRGHSSLFAATDAALLVQNEGNGVHSFTVDRQKDGEEGERFGFRLEPVELEPDEDGEPRSSLVVEPADPPAGAKRSQLQGKKAEALKELEDLFARGMGKPAPASAHIPPGVQVVKLELWREMVTGRGLLDGKNPRQQWSEIISGLRQAGRISIWQEHVWLVNR